MISDVLCIVVLLIGTLLLLALVWLALEIKKAPEGEEIPFVGFVKTETKGKM